MELHYQKTDDMEYRHGLGVFTTMGRSYCAACIAGQGPCRHRAERLWYQYHHWTEERLGIDRPPTLDSCGWDPGGKALMCDVRAKIHEQQCVKHNDTLSAQADKIACGVRRDCTDGKSADYQQHLNITKRVKHPGRFTEARTSIFYDLIRE